MKTITTIILVCFVTLAHGAEKLFDDALAKNAVAVLRVEYTAQVITNRQFQFFLVWPIQVLKNESGERLGHTFQVGVLKGKGGIPKGECTIYIERYKTNGFWVLVGGDPTNGVSHIKGKDKL